MTDPNLPRPALWIRSVSESDNDLMNSATNYQMYPGQLMPPGRTESQPSISGQRMTKESSYSRAETSLRVYYLWLELLKP